MGFKKLFFEGRVMNKESDDIEEIVTKLRNQIEFIHGLKISDIIDFLDTLGRHWARDKEVGGAAGQSARYLAGFLKPENLETMLDTALRKKEALDGFVRLNSRNVVYHAQPRGLVVHWIAGNVPILGFISILQALLTKNVSLVKASSKAYAEFLVLLRSFSKINTGKIQGADLSKTIGAVLVDSNDRENQEKLSLAADVRIAWGGQAAMESIMNLPKKITAEDLIYGPKYSYAVVGKECLGGNTRDTAYRLAIDASVFDQYGCSSPHTVFVEQGGKVTTLEFADELAKQLDLVNRRLIPKGKTDPKKAMDILTLRSKYEFVGHVFSSKNTDWTVIYSDEEGLAVPCFSRVVFVRPIKDIHKVKDYNDRHKQTMGIAVADKRRYDFVDKATLFGVDRCPALGKMSFFESPWDGMFALDRMVRWVTTCK